MALAFTVQSYSLDNLKQLLEARCPVPRYVLDAKQHLQYLDSYFQHADIAARTIVVEHEYIDRDFLLDYAGYYVRCFSQYHRWCARFHFFAHDFNQSDFQQYLEHEASSSLSEEALAKAYLGFLVAKPLPETIIGRTCLKTYDGQSDRWFTYIRDYNVSLFGTRLVVKSLAFQEQDTVAAACATSAIWTAFQGTGLLFQHEIPSPMMITRSAIERTPTESRAFPAADGLTDLQMAEAVRGIGLDPLVLPAASNWQLKAASYAYLRAGIPVLMNCIVADYSLMGNLLDPDEDLFGHAIALVGYRIDSAKPITPGSSGILLRAAQMTKIYSHDDQVGPFARMEFSTAPESIKNPSDPLNHFVVDSVSCTWGQGGGIEGRLYISEKVLIPLVTTIRIPFDSILNALVYFDEALETLRQNKISTFAARQVWDIYLVSSNQLKHEWLKNTSVSPTVKSDLLLTALPRFVWRVSACDGATIQTDFLFDPSDIEQGPMLIKVVGYEQAHYTELLRVSDVYSNDSQYSQEVLLPHGKIWEHLRQLFQRASQAA